MVLLHPNIVMHSSLAKRRLPALREDTGSKEKAIPTPAFSSDNTASLHFGNVIELSNFVLEDSWKFRHF